MPTDTDQQIAAFESRLATMEDAIRLITEELSKAKEREEGNIKLRHTAETALECGLLRWETLCPRFTGAWFKDSASGRFSAVPTTVINRDIFASMQLVLNHGAQLISIGITGQVTGASSATKIHLSFKLRRWLEGGSQPELNLFEIETGAGLFSGAKAGLNLTVENIRGYYDLELKAHWDEPRTTESADPTIRFHAIELWYDIGLARLGDPYRYPRQPPARGPS
jgi:hypothetical protein